MSDIDNFLLYRFFSPSIMPKKVLFSESVISRIISESLLEASATEIRDKYYQDIPEQDYKQLIFADPTSNPNNDKMGKYGKWILTLYKQGKLNTGNISELRNLLTYFNRFNGRMENKDINHYDSLPALYDAVKVFVDNPNQATSKSDELRRERQEGAEKVYEDGEWLVIVPKTEQAACLYGKGTKWCTSATKSENKFDAYNKRGPLYININKQTGKKYQFHFQTGTFMDELNNEIKGYVPETIGMSNGLYEFYTSNPKRFPYAKLAFRFGPVNIKQETKSEGTVVFYRNVDFGMTEGWMDLKTGDSLTGNEMFAKCFPFKNGLARYRSLRRTENLMKRDGQPLFSKDLPDGCHFTDEDFGPNLFLIYKNENRALFNLLKKNGEFVFDDWPESCRIEDGKIVANFRDKEKRALFHCAEVDFNGNVIGWHEKDYSFLY